MRARPRSRLSEHAGRLGTVREGKPLEIGRAGKRQAGSGVLSQEEGTGIRKQQWELKMGAMRV